MDETYKKIESILTAIFGKEGASILVDDLKIAMYKSGKALKPASKSILNK